MAAVSGGRQPGAHQICLILFILQQSDTHDDQFAGGANG